jgi:hypothetical protein
MNPLCVFPAADLNRWAWKMKRNTLNRGDKVLLFTNLPYDYQSDLPVSPTAGVTVDNPPYSLLETRDDDHLPCYLLPGIRLPGFGMNHCCFVSKASEPMPKNTSREDFLFLYLTALRLLAPADISVASHFEYGSDDEPVSLAALVNTHSAWQPNPEYRYTGALLMYAGELLDRIVGCLTAGPIRLKYAFTLFSQVTNGFSRSYQMAVLGLYSALEALFSPSGARKNDAQTLGTRVGAYLSAYDTGKTLGDWITLHYRDERHSLSHGFWHFSPDHAQAQERSVDFGKLHETVRLSLLGFLSMSAAEAKFLELRGRKLQHALDSITSASGQFLQNQRMWLG